MSTQFKEEDHPRGSGGMFAEKIQSEATGVVLTAPSAKPKPIMAHMTLQQWDEDNDDYAREVGTVEFDAAPVLAGIVPGLSPAQLSDLDTNIGDQVFHEAVSRGLVPDHEGPFELYVQNSLDEALAENPNYFDTPYPHHLTVRHPDAVLQSPLSPYELGALADENGMVTANSVLDLEDMIDGDLENHLNNISRTLTGDEMLVGPSAVPVRVEDGQVIFRLSGDITNVIECMDEDEVELFEAGRATRA